MNLFLLAWNLPKEKVSLVLSEIDKMKAVYQLLDPNTIWSFGRESSVFAASMHTANEAAAPRIYVKRSEDRVVLYEGSLVDRTGSFPAHDAEALSLHWNDLPNVLEGHFVTARITKNPPSIEIINDALGMCQTYYVRQNNVWLISNSSLLLSRISNMNELDPLGVSFFLCRGSGGADRTLRRGIRVIPGGQHWKWEEGFAEPQCSTYFDRAQLSRPYRKKLTKADVEQLASELIQTCYTLAQNFGALKCPITAGRDSRLMAALLIRGEIEAQYFTSGLPKSPDVQIGKQIADYFNLPYTSETEEAVNDPFLRSWEDACRRLIQQNDGMLSLRSIDYASKQSLSVESLGITLYGAGGEIARGFYNSDQIFLGKCSSDYLQQYLLDKLLKNNQELLHQETIVTLQNYLEEFVQQVIDEGFSPVAVPDIFHAYEQVRRWVGVHISAKQSAHKDAFSPFCTRPFIKTAYSLPALRRYSEHVHYQLLDFLVPDLHRFPFVKNWNPQQPIVNLFYSFWNRTLRKKVAIPIKKIVTGRAKSTTLDMNHQLKKFHRLESKRTEIRELCLDRSNSSLWNFIDRSEFERITSSSTNPLEREQHLILLWHIFTLFKYADIMGF
ncbi:MAG: hypothetical protein QNJ41_18135 [Xenococcaceae cyanobacterium MO_188.B32]|nr:hypothetical protein [Xenococcaceae cyanobacterium MO_188.B32]